MSDVTMTTDDLNAFIYDAYRNAANIVREMNMHPNYTIADALDAVASTFK